MKYMALIYRIKEYFRKRRKKREYKTLYLLTFETAHRECPYLRIGDEGNQFCIRNTNILAYIPCNAYRCTYIVQKMDKFNKDFKKTYGYI